jgi:streptomycin 6-kinase
VLVHGDAHPANALLRLGRPGLPPQLKFVDPDGLFCEPAYDLGISMREWSEELLAGDALALGKVRCALLHDLTGVDETAIWQWGFIERVSTGLLLWQLGFRTDAVQHFAIVEAWMAAPGADTETARRGNVVTRRSKSIRIQRRRYPCKPINRYPPR